MIGPETIVGVAIQSLEGIVYTLPPPNRHNHVIVMMGRPTFKQKCPQGFITNTGRFVGRREAFLIAEKSGQLIRKTGQPDQLYSEDLW